MIVVDTSVWVEFLRRSGHPAAIYLRSLLEEEADLAVTEVVLMELFAGARSSTEVREIRSRLTALPLLRLQGLADYEEAALIYRTCRQGGETIRALTDCLIAVVAIREDAAVLHNDSDFDAIARHTTLRLEPRSPIV